MGTVDTRRIAMLEEHFILELRVASDFYGCSSTEWRMWAEEAFGAGDHIEHYFAAWKRGKREAWTRLDLLAAELRRTAGDVPAEWESRLTRLEIAARREIHAVQPNRASAFELDD